MHAAETRPLAIITGGSRGLGFESAKALALQGFELALIAKDSGRLSSAAELIHQFVAANQTNAAAGSDSAQISISTFACDLEQPQLVRELIDSIYQSLPTPQLLILAHGSDEREDVKDASDK